MSLEISQRLETILPRVEKPGRYLGGEINQVVKNHADVAVSIVYAFPDTYEIGMSNNGFRILYELTNRRPDAVAERAYAPWTDMEAELRAAGLPLFSHETKTPLAEFDAIGITLQSELNYTNVLFLLDLAGLPLSAADRTDGMPIVIGGGPCTANPEPIADFFDVILIGDGELVIHAILDTLAAHGGRHGSRQEILFALAGIEGCYVPGFVEPVFENGRQTGVRSTRAGVEPIVTRTFVRTLDPSWNPKKPLLPLIDVVHPRLSIELMRGCTQGCRFCQAGYWYRPVRELNPDDVMRLAVDGIRETGWDEVGLLSLSTADYSQVEPLTKRLAAELAPERTSVSLPSLRAEAFSVKLAESVSKVRKSGFTFAPETGSDRLRRLINKTFTNDDMLQAAEVAYGSGWSLIKVYTMIGLPTENDQDLDELAALARNIEKIGKKHGRNNMVNVAVGCFVPKSFTPFQWWEFDGIENLRRKISYLKRNVRGKNVKLSWHDPEEAEVEAVLSRGDRRVGRVILEAYRLGAKFDAWGEHFDYRRWLQAFENAGLDRQTWLGGYDAGAYLPWDFIDAGIFKKFLKLELKRALDAGAKAVSDCKWGECHACGIPGMPTETVLAKPFADSGSTEPASAPAYRMREAAEKIASSAAPPRNDREESPAAPPCNDTVQGPARRAHPTQSPNRVEPGEEIATTAYRLTFTKLGTARFLSHRNVMDILERALRASGAPVTYSEGWNPHMKISMGPALALGLESDGELFDVELTAGFESDHLAAVNRLLPQGIRVLGASPLPAGSRGLGKAVSEAVYRVTPRREADGDRWTERLEAGLAALTAAEPGAPATDSPAAETAKFRPAILRAERHRNGSLHGDGSSSSGTGLDLTLNLANARGQTAQPRDILDHFFGYRRDEQHGLRVVRTAIGLG